MPPNSRSSASVCRALWRLPLFIFWSLRAFFVFRNPVRFLLAYALRRGWQQQVLILRSGHKIYLSASPDDITTVFCTFCKREYGSVPRGGTVIDIGANIGVFTVFCITQGAASIYAAEPCPESLAYLRKNISANRGERTVTVVPQPITGRNQTVAFPVRSSVRNKALTPGPRDACLPPGLTQLTTLTLTELINRYQIDHVDLLKMDCEGAEYDIVSSTPKSTWELISRFRLEYHNGRLSDLTNQLRQHGLTAAGLGAVPHKQLIGVIWLTKASTIGG